MSWGLLVATTVAGALYPLSCAGEGAGIPFDFLHNQIVLRVTIQGQGPYNFILDTGTHTSTVDLELARRLNLPLGSQAEVAGAGQGQPENHHTTCPELRVGPVVVRDLEAVALDLSGPSRSLGRTLDGVLGYSFLQSRITQIDYFRRRIRFLSEAPARAAPASRKTISFPMQFRAGSVLPVLEECYVNGKRLPVTLDTGSSLGLVLFPRAVRKLGLEELAREGIPMRAAGYRGEALLSKGWVRSVVLLHLDLGAIEVAYVIKGYADEEPPELRGGNLGNAVLQDFVLTLDYRDHMVTMENTLEQADSPE